MFVCKMHPVDAPIAPSSDDPLAHPTRARLFQALSALRRMASTAELASTLGLHPNGVRTHLERLSAAGLVTRTREARPRGRPRDGWSVAPNARPGGEAPEAYCEFAGWLAAAFTCEPDELERVERTGRRVGRDLLDEQPATPLPQALASAFAALGFAPRPEPTDRPHAVALCLGNCPYRDVARVRPEIACTLHRGIAHGLLDRLDPGAALTRFEPRDPDRAGCVVEVVAIPGGAMP